MTLGNTVTIFVPCSGPQFPPWNLIWPPCEREGKLDEEPRPSRSEGCYEEHGRAGSCYASLPLPVRILQEMVPTDARCQQLARLGAR